MRHGEYRPDVAVGFVDGGTLFGAVGLKFENAWDGQLSIYVERPDFLSRATLAALFDMAFTGLGLARLTCHIAKGNKRARRFVERLGWKLEGVKRKGFDGRRDAVIYGLLAGECRWLRKK